MYYLLGPSLRDELALLRQVHLTLDKTVQIQALPSRVNVLRFFYFGKILHSHNTPLRKGIQLLADLILGVTLQTVID